MCERQEKQREAAVKSEAAVLMQQYPKEAFDNELFGPAKGEMWNEDVGMAWARSSFSIVSTNPKVYGAVKENSEPDASYLEFVQSTTRRQVVLAGYRLGRLLAENMPTSSRDAGVIEVEEEEEEERARAGAAEVAVILLVLPAVALIGAIFWLVIQLRNLGWSPSTSQACCTKERAGARFRCRQRQRERFH